MLRNCPKHVKMTTLTLFREENVIEIIYSLCFDEHLFYFEGRCRCRRRSLGPYIIIGTSAEELLPPKVEV